MHSVFSCRVLSLCITFAFLMPCRIFSVVKLKYDLMTATDVLLEVVWMKISVPAELPRKCWQCSSFLSAFSPGYFKLPYDLLWLLNITVEHWSLNNPTRVMLQHPLWNCSEDLSFWRSSWITWFVSYFWYALSTNHWAGVSRAGSAVCTHYLHLMVFKPHLACCTRLQLPIFGCR